MTSDRWGRRTTSLPQKSARVFGEGASDRWGQPRTTALPQKSARVLGSPLGGLTYIARQETFIN
jgi:hypothetical protein